MGAQGVGREGSNVGGWWEQRWWWGAGSCDSGPSTLSCPDSKLQEELQALRETVSNLTVSTEAEFKDLRTHGEGAGAEAGGSCGMVGMLGHRAVSPAGGGVGRKMKALESQMEKQQEDLSQGQRGSSIPAPVCGLQGSPRPNQGVWAAVFPPTILKCFTESNFYFSPKPRGSCGRGICD